MHQLIAQTQQYSHCCGGSCPRPEKGAWVQLPDDARGLGDGAVFVSYELVETDAAEREMRDLQSNAPAGCCISTTEVPVIAEKPPAAALPVVKAAAVGAAK